MPALRLPEPSSSHSWTAEQSMPHTASSPQLQGQAPEPAAPQHHEHAHRRGSGSFRAMPPLPFSSSPPGCCPTVLSPRRPPALNPESSLWPQHGLHNPNGQHAPDAQQAELRSPRSRAAGAPPAGRRLAPP